MGHAFWSDPPVACLGVNVCDVLIQCLWRSTCLHDVYSEYKNSDISTDICIALKVEESGSTYRRLTCLFPFISLKKWRTINCVKDICFELNCIFLWKTNETRSTTDMHTSTLEPLIYQEGVDFQSPFEKNPLRNNVHLFGAKVCTPPCFLGADQTKGKICDKNTTNDNSIIENKNMRHYIKCPGVHKRLHSTIYVGV